MIEWNKIYLDENSIWISNGQNGTVQKNMSERIDTYFSCVLFLVSNWVHNPFYFNSICYQRARLSVQLKHHTDMADIMIITPQYINGKLSILKVAQNVFNFNDWTVQQTHLKFYIWYNDRTVATQYCCYIKRTNDNIREKKINLSILLSKLLKTNVFTTHTHNFL